MQVLADESDKGIFSVENARQFPLITAVEYFAAPELNVTGVVNVDISRAVPIISLASGRLLEIRARHGGTVKKGDLLMRVQSSDISGTSSGYRQTLADDGLARAQLERAKTLLDAGPITRKVQSLSSPTISDLSSVWVICEVYANQMEFVRLGESAGIHVGAYPDRVLRGRITNILPTLDTGMRVAKVRLRVGNPGILRLGMFVTVTFFGSEKDRYAAVPASAILHMHDREWVYVPLDGHRFQRVQITAGQMLPGNQQEILAGLSPGQKVIADALVLQKTVDQ